MGPIGLYVHKSSPGNPPAQLVGDTLVQSFGLCVLAEEIENRRVQGPVAGKTDV